MSISVIRFEALLKILLLFIVVVSPAFAEKSKMQCISLEEAKKQAVAEKKNILVVIISDSCCWSRKQRDEIMTDSFVGKLVNKFYVCIDANKKTAEGREFDKAYPGNGVPRIYIVTPEGEKIFTQDGASREPKKFVPFLLLGINGDKKQMKDLLKTVKKKYGKNPADKVAKRIMAIAYWKAGKKSNAGKLYGSSYMKTLQSSDDLNMLSWVWAYYIDAEPKLALKAAQKSVKIKKQWYNVDTMAYAYYKNKDYKNAIKYGKESIQMLGKKNKPDVNERLALYEKALAEKK